MTFKILKNFSNSLESDLKNLWINKNQLKHDKWDYYDRQLAIRYYDDYVLPDNSPLLDIVKEYLGIKPFGGAYMESHARCGYTETHVDDRRGCGINVPIQVDVNNSLFYTSPKESTPSEVESVKHDGFNPENFIFYDMSKPILMNAKSLHGFANWSDSNRVIFTFSFRESYEEVLKNIPNDWL